MDLSELCEETEGFSGGDLKKLCSLAATQAVIAANQVNKNDEEIVVNINFIGNSIA